MTTKQTIQAWLDETQVLMVEKYDQLGFRASGDWEKSLENEVTEGKGKYTATIKGANYTYWMEHGRKPGKFPPINMIKKWIIEKPVHFENISLNSLSFLIARKIARDGTKIRPGVVSDVITKPRIDDLLKRIGQSMILELKSDIIKDLKDVNN
jgi:hypothetical protein